MRVAAHAPAVARERVVQPVYHLCGPLLRFQCSAAVDAAQKYWERQLVVIAAELNARPHDDFLLGPTFLACDVLLGHCILWAASLEWLPAPSLPEESQVVIRYMRKLIGRPAFQKCVEMGCWSESHLASFQ